MSGYYRITDNLLRIDLKVTPDSSKNEIAGVKDNRLCVRVAASPEDGKANAKLCAFLSDFLDCAKRDVSIIKGEKSRLKTVTVPALCEKYLIDIDALGTGMKQV